MERARWTYTGRIDCFGMNEEERDMLFQRTAEEVWSSGGEIQVAPLENQWDTDRYEIHIDIPGSTRPVVALLHAASGLLDSDHVTWTLEGYERENMQREDLILKGGEVSRVPFVFAAAEAEVLTIDTDLDLLAH